MRALNARSLSGKRSDEKMRRLETQCADTRVLRALLGLGLAILLSLLSIVAFVTLGTTRACDECAFGARCRPTGGAGVECDCRHLECAPNNWDAICANDGKVYQNECLLKQSSCWQQKPIVVSQCPPPTQPRLNACSRDQCLRPHSRCATTADGRALCSCPECQSASARAVCASDGQTYASECQLQRSACLSDRHLRVVHWGHCGDKCRLKRCQFGAQCVDGECRCDHLCAGKPSDAPFGHNSADGRVCGTDGISYDNECLLRRQSCHLSRDIRVKHNGSCADFWQCLECLEHGFEPVCANDGITYDNECQMQRSACLQRRDLTALFYGQCEDDERDDGSAHEMAPKCSKECRFGAQCVSTSAAPRCECQFACSDVRAVVCGLLSNNATRFYDNECRLREDSCRRQTPIGRCACDRPVGLPCGRCPAGSACLGGVCCECGCNRFGSREPFVCHRKRCRCRTGVGGVRCDRCEPGFFAFGANGCSECRCDARGAARADCHQTTGGCVCKDGVSGLKCDRCSRADARLRADGCEQ